MFGMEEVHVVFGDMFGMEEFHVEFGDMFGMEEADASRSERLERFARLEWERLAATAARASPSTVLLTESLWRPRVASVREGEERAVGEVREERAVGEGREERE